MCKQIEAKTLYEETKTWDSQSWRTLNEISNAVQVTCRTYELDFVIHKRVKIDGTWVVDKRKAGHLPGTRNSDLIRDCINIFDALVEDHPCSRLVAAPVQSEGG